MRRFGGATRRWPPFWRWAAPRCAISQQQEVQIGAQQSQQVNAQLPIIHDPEINRYLNVLGDSLAQRDVGSDLDWHFFHGEHERLQRVRAPGGYVYVNRGVAERSDRLDQFASVIGARDRARRASALGQADAADAGREHRRDGVVRAHEVCNPASAQAGVKSAADCSSRSSAATTKRRPTRPASKSWCAPGSTRTACRRCSRSCSPNARSARRRSITLFTDHPLEEDRIAAYARPDRAISIRRSFAR